MQPAEPSSPTPVPAPPQHHGFAGLLDRIAAFVQRANTITVGGVGLSTALGDVAIVLLHAPAESFVSAHLGSGAPLVNGLIDQAQNAALATLPASIVASYVGMPKGLNRKV